MLTERAFGPKPSVPFFCVPDLLEHQARRIPDAPAILADGRAPLTYGGLHRHVDAMGRTLRGMGIGRRDRVAVVLPNGPELPVAILGVVASAVCAPVNPAFGTGELERYFADLQLRAVITPAGIDSPARRAALARGVRVIELATAADAAAGLFTLAGEGGSAPSDEPARPDDTALLLPTSGTTSRPKIVLQRHAGICASAYAHGAVLALSEADRCLNVLPLFHGHGLTGTVVASLAAGASVVCTPGFDAGRFAGWLTAFAPTWFSAVPTMHQAILAHARLAGDRLADRRLRFVRSSSASLPPSVFAQLERIFESPVIEWYGMTEVTSSPMACNPLPPRQRKAGSVGVPVALDVAIMGERGDLLPDGQTGEVVVRGASVTRGYDRNPAATAAAFHGDWFKTGDLGYFDADGYLFLAGRLREMINRGGEKVAPQEVDEVLLDHPAVAEAVTFAVPHATLGEDVASAIVLRPDAAATPRDIRRFAGGRIADFKVPRQVLIVGEIPKGPTGKVQRIGLAARLGLADGGATRQGFVASRTPLEQVLAGIWAEVLDVERVGVHDDFFALGGDSLQAARALIRLHQVTGVVMAVSGLFEAPTVSEMAAQIEGLTRSGEIAQPAPAIRPMPRDNGAAPASLAQEHIWKLQRALPDTPFFNILYPLRLRSAVDATALERGINEIVRRHETLRTTFMLVDGRSVQVIAPQLVVPLRLDDLRTLPPRRREAVEHELIQEEVLHCFDLARGPLIRARLVHLAEQEHLLLVSLHQLICDGWSLGVFVDELATLYDALITGRDSPLPPLRVQFADFVHWQRRWPSHSQISAQLDYWREKLRDPLPAMRPVTSRPGRAVDDLFSARREVALPIGLAEAAKRLSHEEGGTLFMALVSAFKTLLHRYVGLDDVRVATHVANRSRPGAERLIGPLVNTVVLRTGLGGDPSAREVIRRVRATTLAAFANQDLPFDEVTAALKRERGLEPGALASAMIWLQNTASRSLTTKQGLSIEEANPRMLVPLVTITAFDVILMLKECSDGLVGTCVYKPHLFRAKTIDRVLRDFQRVLECMTMHPERPISEIRVSLKEKIWEKGA